MPVGEVRVRGLRELILAEKKLAADVSLGLKPALLALAEPVRVDAESNALGAISNIGGRWSRMRVGATSKTVYVAPKTRRRGGSTRPNLAPLLMEQAMQPSLTSHQEEIVEGLDRMLDTLGVRNGF